MYMTLNLSTLPLNNNHLRPVSRKSLRNNVTPKTTIQTKNLKLDTARKV